MTSPQRPLSLYLRLALGIAGLSAATCIAIFILGFTGTPPFRFGDAARMSHLADVATISAAVSTLFALMVGAIAIIAVIVADRAETRAIEQIRIDVGRLWMALHSIRNRALLYTAPDLVRDDLFLFEEERKTIAGVVQGTTGFLIYTCQDRFRTEEDGIGTLTTDLAGLVDFLTLRPSGHPYFTQLAQRANTLSAKLSVLSDEDMAVMARAAQKMGRGLSHAREIAEKDEIGSFLNQMKDDAAAALPVPSRAEIAAFAERAQKRIGGQAGDLVRQMGANARDGGPREVELWHKLKAKLEESFTEDEVDGAAPDGSDEPSGPVMQ
ncbi:hypothetical protein [Parvularcula oceani]|uniref:hypothetical protein n=1 Tax=Parvularcula oceani TaxID=1247963 RepID=UPI0004E18325|nr:hypothetical protein [Parvularcula oceani]